MERFSFTSSEPRLGKLARALAGAGFVLGPWAPVRRTRSTPSTAVSTPLGYGSSFGTPSGPNWS